MTDDIRAEGIAYLQWLAAAHIPPDQSQRLTDTLEAIAALARIKAPHSMIEEVARMALATHPATPRHDDGRRITSRRANM